MKERRVSAEVVGLVGRMMDDRWKYQKIQPKPCPPCLHFTSCNSGCGSTRWSLSYKFHSSMSITLLCTFSWLIYITRFIYSRESFSKLLLRQLFVVCISTPLSKDHIFCWSSGTKTCMACQPSWLFIHEATCDGKDHCQISLNI